MRKTNYKIFTAKIRKKWEKEKSGEWESNSNFWVKIIRESLDPYRTLITNQAILDSLKRKNKLKILDAGCGEGYLSRLLAQKGHFVFGIDFSKNLIQSALSLEQQNPLGINYRVGDFRKTDFPSSFFDVIVSHQTIIEIPDPEKSLKEFSRLLKKNGIVLCLFLHPCFDIDKDWLGKKNLAYFYFNRVKVNKGKYLVSGITSPHSYFYLHLPLCEWIKIFNRAGFTILDLKEPHPSLNKLMTNKWLKDNFKKPMFILIEAKKN